VMKSIFLIIAIEEFFESRNPRNLFMIKMKKKKVCYSFAGLGVRLLPLTFKRTKESEVF
jgi:hypothetical protein